MEAVNSSSECAPHVASPSRARSRSAHVAGGFRGLPLGHDRAVRGVPIVGVVRLTPPRSYPVVDDGHPGWLRCDRSRAYVRGMAPT